MTKTTEQIWADVKARGYITEQELKLLQRRINAKTIQPIDAMIDDGIKLSAEQTEKGKRWLLNLWQTPAGRERQNNPFGFREIEALGRVNAIYLIDWVQHNQAYYFYPVYKVEGKENSFQYYIALGQIHITG